MCHDCDSRVTYSLIALVWMRVFGGASGLVMVVISVFGRDFDVDECSTQFPRAI